MSIKRDIEIEVLECEQRALSQKIPVETKTKMCARLALPRGSKQGLVTYGSQTKLSHLLSHWESDFVPKRGGVSEFAPYLHARDKIMMIERVVLLSIFRCQFEIGFPKGRMLIGRLKRAYEEYQHSV